MSSDKAPHELETIAAQGIPQRDERAQLDATLLMGSSPPDVDLTRAPLVDRGFDERYEDIHLLGEGGMGEVRLCRDPIGCRGRGRLRAHALRAGSVIGS